MSDALFHGDLVSTRRLLYTPSVFAKNNLLHLQEIGELRANKPHTSKRARLNSYLFFTVRSGSGVLHYEDRTYPLTKGSCVFIDCSRPYYHQTSDDLWHLNWIHFNGPTAAGIYEKYLERGGLPAFTTDLSPAYAALCEDLLTLAGSETPVRDMKINAGLSELLTLLMTDSWHPEAVRADSKKTALMTVRSYLDEHYSEKITLDELAERFYINKFYLTRIFKEQFGMSINSYLLQVRITHAKYELRFSDKTADAIGRETGIGSGYYFSRVFRQVEGVSPMEYRKMWRGK